MIKFGTDGIRGIYGEQLTSDIALKIGYALGTIKKQVKVLVGKDTRLSGTELECELIKGISYAGGKVKRLLIVPTACMSYAVKKLNYDYAVMITASHNSWEYNGIKIFDNQGDKIDNDTESIIENIINDKEILVKLEDLLNDNQSQEYRKIALKNVKNIKKTLKFNEFLINFKRNLNNVDRDIVNDFTKYLRKHFTCKHMPFTVVIDCDYGSNYKLAKKVFNLLFDKVIYLHDKKCGGKINEKCGATNTLKLRERVISENADFGIAFDGDADRFVAVDDKGNEVDGNKLLYLYPKYLKGKKALKNNTAVGTVYSNTKIIELLKKEQIDWINSEVGDKKVAKIMRDKNLSFGGEESGHYIFGDILPTGDGLLSAIMLCNILFESKSTLSKLTDFKLNYFLKESVKFDKEKQSINIFENNKFVEELESIKNSGKNKVEIVVNKSGTEPVYRVVVQSKNEKSAKEYMKIVKNLIKTALDL